MAVIVPTLKPRWDAAAPGGGVFSSLTVTTLSGTDSFVYAKGTDQVLILFNPTGGSLSPVIDGGDGTTWYTDGNGARAIGPGYPAFAIAAGIFKIIPLDTMEGFLQGVIAISASVGLKAALINPVA